MYTFVRFSFVVLSMFISLNGFCEDIRGDMLGLVDEVVKDECQNNNMCVPPDTMKAIMLKESSFDKFALYFEKKLARVKFGSIPDEDQRSKQMSHYSFGLMQINWGYHKHTCGDIVKNRAVVGTPIVYALFDPETNIRCAVRVFHEKMATANRKTRGKNNLHEAIRLYNGAKAPMSYVNDVLRYASIIKLNKNL